MARKPALSIETLTPLGVEKLASLVVEEAERNAAFRKLVKAALAGAKGPEAIAKLIDRRLAALEKARAFIDWEKVRAFRDDIDATLTTIVSELASASPPMAIERLLRFIATHEQVFERVDDSHGRVQDVYYRAIEQAGAIAARLSDEEKELLPGRIMDALGATTHGYLSEVAETVVPHLPAHVLKAWEQLLPPVTSDAEGKKSRDERDWNHIALASQYRDIRQAISSSLGDMDSLIAIEDTKHPNTQDTIGIAGKLLEAGRLNEALQWVRKPVRPGLRYLRASDMADEVEAGDIVSTPRALLEARILDATGDRDAAQALRWQSFQATLDADVLRAYIAALGDFEEFDALDRAFAHTLSQARRYLALEFFLEWPRLDLAAKLVVDNHSHWEGRNYDILAPAAQTLEHEHALAGSVLYRALINDILGRARSKAYGHAARYLVRLDALAISSDPDARTASISTHDDYRATLREKHGRKSAFWAEVDRVSR